MLVYAAQSGADLPTNIIDSLIKADDELRTGNVSSPTAVAFYAAYAALAAKVAPVTIETLSVTEARTKGDFRRLGWGAGIFTLLVIAFSVVAFITKSMSEEIEAKINHGDELAVKLSTLRSMLETPAIIFRTQNNESMATIYFRAARGSSDLATAGGSSGVAAADGSSSLAASVGSKVVATAGGSNDGAAIGGSKSIDPEVWQESVTRLQDLATTMRGALRTATKLNFFVWNTEKSPLDAPPPSWKNTYPPALLEISLPLVDVEDIRDESICKTVAFQPVRDFAMNVRGDTLLIYGALAAYFLPVLYAALGAFAYNLRDFSRGVRGRTYHPSLRSTTRARTVAAITAGAIIGLFNNFGEGIALSPLATAFLVGYGVEGFFSFLDTLIAAFSNVRREAERAQQAPLPAKGP